MKAIKALVFQDATECKILNKAIRRTVINMKMNNGNKNEIRRLQQMYDEITDIFVAFTDDTARKRSYTSKNENKTANLEHTIS